MFEKLMMPVALFLLFAGVLSVFLSRSIVRKKTDMKDENVTVKTLKVSGFVVAIVSLIAMYFLSN